MFLQGGPLERVQIWKNRDGSQNTYGFIVYKHAMSVPYALNLFEGTTLYNRQLNLKVRQAPEQPSQLMTNMNVPNINHILQYGNQMMLGHPMVNMVPMFMPPGMVPYPSQGNSAPYVKDDRRGVRNHPYHRERERDRYSDRGNRNHRDHRSHRPTNEYHRNNGRNYR